MSFLNPDLNCSHCESEMVRKHIHHSKWTANSRGFMEAKVPTEKDLTTAYRITKNDLHGIKEVWFHGFCFENFTSAGVPLEEFRSHNFSCSTCFKVIRDEYYTIIKCKLDFGVADGGTKFVAQVAEFLNFTQFCIECFDLMAGEDFIDSEYNQDIFI